MFIVFTEDIFEITKLITWCVKQKYLLIHFKQIHTLNILIQTWMLVSFLIPDLDSDLWHRHSISCLCMLFKTYHNPTHSLHSELPSLFHPVRETRYAVTSHRHSFSVVRCSTAHYSRCFIPTSIKCLNDLLEELWNAWSFKNLNLVLVRFYWIDIFSLRS